MGNNGFIITHYVPGKLADVPMIEAASNLLPIPARLRACDVATATVRSLQAASDHLSYRHSAWLSAI